MTSSLLGCARSVSSLGFYVFGEKWGLDVALRDWVGAHATAYSDQLRNLGTEKTKGAKRRRVAQEAVLASLSGRVCCLISAAAKRGETYTQDALTVAAHQIRPWNDCGEPITLVSVPKGDGTYRPTLKLGVRRSALNYLCRDLLLTVWGKPLDDFNGCAGGTHRAVRLFRKAIEDGRPWVGKVDVKNCFSSFQHDGIVDAVQLSDRVVRNAILIPKDATIVNSYGVPVSGSVRETLLQGLPQGAPASSFIASHLLLNVLGPWESLVMMLRYADDIAWACETEEEAVATLNSLIACLGAHPAGELTLHTSKPVHVSSGINFLGYRIIGSPSDGPLATHAWPNNASFERFRGRLVRGLKACAGTDAEDFAFKRTGRWIRSWSEWNPSEARLDHVFGQSLAMAAQFKSA